MARERRIAIYTFVLGGDVSDAKYKELEAMSLDTGGKCYRGSQDDIAGYTGIMFDETVDYATDSNEGGISDPCSGEGRREVDSRTLAILSALSYEDGTEAMRGSGFYGEIVGSPPEERGEAYYFLDGASVEPGGSDDYVRDWVVAEYENTSVSQWGMFGDTYFSATVYAHGDDIVLAYRGMSEDPEWINDVEGFLSNFTLEEPKARDMVRMVARKYAASGKSVYITGHSLGGYLAQVGAAELIRDGRADKLRSCEYFNGMGLDYAPWAQSTTNSTPFTYVEDRRLLQAYSDAGGTLVLHRMYGDFVSPLGTHSGQVRTYQPHPDCVRNHMEMHRKRKEKGAVDDTFDFKLTVTLSGFDNDGWELLRYGRSMGLYGEDLLWIVHETDSFLYDITRGPYRHEGGA